MTSARNVRFLGTGNVPSPPLITPQAAAKNALSFGLNALHNNIRDNEVVTREAKEFLRLLELYKSKKKTVSKFDSGTFIPLSCRIKVDLVGSSLTSKSDKFAELKTKLEEISTTFQTGTAGVFKAAAILELKAVGSALMECSIRFADLLMKYRLLVGNDACREHKSSPELTIMCFLTESVPPNLEMDEGIDNLAYPGNDEDTYDTIKRLMFGTDPLDAYKFLNLTRDTNTQPGPISEEEQIAILQVQVQMKKTLVNCLDKFAEQEKEVQLANAAKEMILLTATTKSADDTGEVLADDGDESNLLPDSMEELKKMMNAAIIDHEKAKNNNSKPVKEKRGAKKSLKKKKKGKGTNGGGASTKKTNQNTQNQENQSSGSKKKNNSSTQSQSNSSGRKRRGKADGAGSGSSTGKSKNKRQRSTERS